MQVRPEQPDGQLQADQTFGEAPADRREPSYRKPGSLANDIVQEAISALEPLSREAPDEANIQFLLGKCYLRQGRRGEATVAFTYARELLPKLEGAIKTAMEANGEEDEEGDE